MVRSEARADRAGDRSSDLGTITRLLRRSNHGDERAREALYAHVYDQLRRIARRQLARHGGGPRLQPTEVVNEAYVRLQEVDRHLTWQDRRHFFRLASTVMRNVLVEHARRHGAQKRGGDRVTVELADAVVEDPKATVDVDVLALDQALRKLAAINPRAADVVEQRYFGGLSPAQTGTVLGISRAAVYRDWDLARAWLARELASE